MATGREALRDQDRQGRGGLVFQEKARVNQKDTQGHVIRGPLCGQSPHGNG